MSLENELDRLISHGPFLLGVDFDGTLAPIVDHPDLAVPHPRAVELLAALAQRDAIDVAIVSGRALADLRKRLGDLPGATLVGEHGNDIGGDVEPNPLIAEATELIRRLAEEAGGATVESKPSSVTFHYRHLEEGKEEPFLERIREWAAEHEDVELLEGKKVAELTTATGSKGDIIRELAGSRPFVYIGDDTTDETVFEVAGPDDLGIKVGEGPTSAAHRVKDVAGVVGILEKIDLASR